jgi:hypothetical protein
LAIGPLDDLVYQAYFKFNTIDCQGLLIRASAELANKMGDTLKSDLIDLMNPFTGWGLTIQKKKRLEWIGYL